MEQYENENLTTNTEEKKDDEVVEVFKNFLAEETGAEEKDELSAENDEAVSSIKPEETSALIFPEEEKTAEEAPHPSLETDAAAQEPKQEQPDKKDAFKNWYVIHTYSGYENKVKDNLIKRIETMNMKDKIFKVLVPTEEEVEFRNGKKRTVQKKIYPGYVLVEMTMGDDSWYVVRNTPGVTGFVGPSVKPTPVSESEIKQILRLMGVETGTKVKISVEKGQGVRVKSGPFKDFTGIVEEIYPDREKVKVLIFIFGRETPVELDFRQIEKL